MPKLRSLLIWAAVIACVAVPLIAAAQSPLLEWREPVYITAGFAGIVGLGLMLVQPLLAAGLLPDLSLAKARRLHVFMGAALVLSVLLHVGGLWITSPPDVIDALTFRSPTPFSLWGVIAMWAIFAAALLAGLRRGLKLRVTTWRKVHTGLAAITVSGTAAHALLIEGTMETLSKVALCIIVVGVTAKVIYDARIWRRRPTRKTQTR
ncbi:MAG: ferric reductase [Pseudomonadota bacterium]